MAAWNSFPLKITYELLGWIAFVSWSISFYPQAILNFRRKSVVGLNFDFVILNLTKHSSYLVYNASLYFSSAIQKQYFNKYGQKQRGHQKVSKIAIAIVFIVWVAAAVCFFVALHRHSWLWLISVFNSIQVCMTVIKYIPQAAMNFMRKSTDGFSIGNILLDFLGGVTNYAQMTAQSIDQHSWVNFYGNIGKTMLSLVSILFDLLFMFQHYILYSAKKQHRHSSPEINGESAQPPNCSSQSENV
ncbi:cystinosin homolog isoform X2 [Hevea brasiliensis]|uniref:cystinosin homolog isoform X2 n=1 Tax=Hevea brasiliensis TaxID=3981 RepID=UPI0025ECB39C|nr:cystinosin homolog isoform X2 [Hevea brasiliensis]